MKISKVFGGLFALLGLAVGVFSLLLAFRCLDAPPALLEEPAAARERAEAVLAAACQGDHDAASRMILGTPHFAMEGSGEDPVEQMVWDRFLQSFSYELVGECFATESGVAQKALVRFLDLNAVTQQLRQRTRTVMEQRMAEAQDMAAIYDENREFRADFVLSALEEATRQALSEDAGTVTREVTLRLIYREGQWWVLPDQQLLSALTGNMIK